MAAAAAAASTEAAAPAAGEKVVKGFAALKPGLEHTLIDVTLAALGDNDVEIRVTHCGICHSDIHLACGHWGPSSVYPQVSGHEVVGEIVAVGPKVAARKVGDKVGVGWYRETCRTCELCLKGRECLCPKSVATAAGGSKGGFSEALRVPADFTFVLPAGLAPEHAAPMLCGGITVYTPLVDHGAVGKRVGIVGIGGLGSMAIQFARARGNYVVALSTSADKAELTKELGAHEFVNTKDAAAVEAGANSLDLIIVTLNVDIDFVPYMKMLRPMGALVIVGAIPGELKLPIFSTLLVKQCSVGGSLTGGRAMVMDMLQFAADHGIKPAVEVFPFPAINDALAKVDANKVRFRAVLKW